MAKVFDERFANINNRKDQIIYNEHLLRYEFAKNLIKDKRVLDIACGSGYGSSLLARSGAREVVGVDIDKRSVEEAQDKYKNENLKFKIGDATKLEFDDDSFDLVVSFETIEHLENDRKYLSEIKRVLKSDGYLIVSTPNDRVSHNKNPYHVREYREEELIELIKNFFPYQKVFKQVNGIASAIIGDQMDKVEVVSLDTKEIIAVYFVVICSFKDNIDDLNLVNLASINYQAYINLRNNRGYKFIDTVYAFLTKLPLFKKLIKKN